MYGQEITDQQTDSISKELREAYNLSDQGEYGESVKKTKEIISLIEGTENYSLLGTANTVLAYAYSELEDKEKAFKYAFKSKDYYIKSKDTANIISAYSDMGVTYEDFKMYDKAYESYKEAVRLSEEYKDKDTLAMIFAHNNVGGILLSYMDKYKQGLEHLKKVELLLKEMNTDDYTSLYSSIYPNIAFAYYKLGQFEASDDYYNKALALADENSFLPIIEGIYKERSNLYRESGEFEKALEMLDEYNVIHDSINAIKNIELAETIEAKYKVKESEDKLNFIEKEKRIQEAQLLKSKRNNSLLIVLSFLLLIAIYLAIKNNRQLKAARDVAENMSRVKSEFYSEISHELRTPLYGVIELSNILLNENTNDKNKEYIESLKFSGNHLLSLINNVLELNKIESEQLAIEEINFNLNTLITNIIDSLEYALRDSNNKIQLKYDKTISNQLVGDSLKLSQILINLISNAVKFTKNGTIVIEIKQVKFDDDKEEVYFAVKDDGIGIPKEKQKNIFEDFYQERSRNDNSYKGTGLGLSIVKRLLIMMGSDINIESKLNVGTTFYFNLLFGSKSDAIGLNKIEDNEGLNKLKGKRFLVVDDNKINQLVTKKLLDQLGLDCDVVDNGFKAISRTKETTYDCILMDLNMPEINGYETTQKIRHFDQDITIIALTAATSEEVKRNIIFYDMDGYILKPFYIDNFIKIILDGMNNRGREDKIIA